MRKQACENYRLSIKGDRFAVADPDTRPYGRVSGTPFGGHRLGSIDLRTR